MTNLFFQKPILNSPYQYPERHWELDASGQPTQRSDTDYNEESFFVRYAHFLGANDPYKSLKAEINQGDWDSLDSDVSRAFDKSKSGRIAVKVINHLGDEVMKVFRVSGEA